MAKPCVSKQEVAGLLSEVYGLDIFTIEDLPSCDDQNMLVNLKDGTKAVLKVAASRAECRGNSNAEDTLAQLELEHQAMERASKCNNTKVPSPLRKIMDVSSSYLSTSLQNYSQKNSLSKLEYKLEKLEEINALSSSIHLFLKENNGDGINFVRVISYLKGEPLGKLLSKITSNHPCFKKLGEATAAMGFSLHLGDIVDYCYDPSSGSGMFTCSELQWHPKAATRDLTWDLSNAMRVKEFLSEVESKEDKDLAAKWLNRFDMMFQHEPVEVTESLNSSASSKRAKTKHEIEHNQHHDGIQYIGLLVGAPEQVIHGDLNDYNVLVANLSPSSSEAERVGEDDNEVSVIDFGDMVWTKRVFDLAICLAYACQQRATPEEVLEVMREVLEGYHETSARLLSTLSSTKITTSDSLKDGADSVFHSLYTLLTSKEKKALPVCIAARLCQSVITCAHSIKLDPGNVEYLSLGLSSGWELLRQLDKLDKSGELDRVCGV